MKGKKAHGKYLVCIWLALLVLAMAAQAEISADANYLSSQSKFAVNVFGLQGGEDYCLILSEEEPSDDMAPTSIHYIRQMTASESGTISLLIVDDELSGCGIWLNSTKLCNVEQVTINSQLNLPDALEIIGESAFEGGNFSYVIVGSHVTTIGSKAFANCVELHNIEIPANVTEIAADAFEGCSAVTIICGEGSYAKTFAEANGLSVELR